MVDGDLDDCFNLKSCKCVLHKSCLEDHLNEQIKQGLVEFTCPNAECQKIIPEKDFRKILTDEMLTLIEHLSLSKVVDFCEDMSWCPTPGCKFAFEKD